MIEWNGEKDNALSGKKMVITFPFWVSGAAKFLPQGMQLFEAGNHCKNILVKPLVIQRVL